jgi:hypothetical protein
MSEVQPDVQQSNDKLPPLMPMQTNPPWVIIIGAVFGVIVLVGFFIFAFLAGTGNQGFICNSFELLAALFSFGAGLSGAFMGGGAAARGQLGDKGQRFSLVYGLGGGVAFFAITFLLFHLFPPTCTGKQSQLELLVAPLSVKFRPYEGYWRKDDLRTDYQNLFIRTENDDLQGQVFVMYGEPLRSVCSIDVHMVTDESRIDDAHRADYELIPHAMDQHVTLYFDQEWLERLANSRGPKAHDQGCFKIFDRRLEGYIALDLNHGRFYYAKSRKGAPESGLGYERRGEVPELLTMAAYAQEKSSEQIPPFSKLRESLSSADPDRRIQAVRLLGENFDQYQNDAVTDLSKPNADPIYLASLVRGLTIGLDTATKKTKLEFGRSDRDLNAPMPYVQQSVSDIVKLSGHDDREVATQARRLIQRYPVSAFGTVFDEMEKQATQEGCDLVKTMPSLEAQLYASIFYYYSRIVQYSFKPSLTANEITKIDEIANTGYSMSKCLSDNLRVDAESLTYAKFVTFSKIKKYSNLARKAAEQFIRSTDSSNYYSPSQIDTAKAFVRRLEHPEVFFWSRWFPNMPGLKGTWPDASDEPPLDMTYSKPTDTPK